MVPNKFEKELRKKFEERAIRPSSDAWETLSKKLDVSAPETKKTSYFSYGLAASFIGILILSIVYFRLETHTNDVEKTLVDTNDKTIETKAISKKEIEGKSGKTVARTDTIKQLPKNATYTTDVDQILKNNGEVTAVEEIKTLPDIPSKKQAMPKRLNEEIINTKILELVVTADLLEQDTDTLTNAEVDSLLRSAQEEILREKVFDQNGSVDAIALLNDVENELDQSFRNKIFESLKEGFLKVRTAIANRNE